MAVTPNSVVHFLYVPLENNYKNQIYFENRTKQTEWMLKQKTGHSFENLTYQRKDNIIRVPKHIDELWNSNYVMYQNTSYNHRWFYAFITKMEYVNDGRTDVTIETDVWQTWFDFIRLKPSFVEREHVLDDTIGLHTFPEQLETGEYICNEHKVDENLNNVLGDLTLIMASTLDITKNSDGKYPANGGGEYGGVYSGLKYYRFDNSSDLDSVLKGYVGTGQDGSISSIFLAPKVIAPFSGSSKAVINSAITHSYYNDITKNYDTMDGYTPKNKKLFCYPFQYLLVSNNTGGSAFYKYEDFDGGDEDICSFLVEGVLCPGCSIRMIPLNYKGDNENDEEGLNLGKYPICNWATDVYTNWLVQNSQSMSISLNQAKYSGIAGTMGNVASLDFGGAVDSAVNGYFQIQSILAEKEKQSLTPPQASGNVNCGDVITSSSKNCFHFYKMCMKKEYLEKLDNYFEMYGYRVNTVKIPNINGRPHWNFVKTIGVNLDGMLPQDDLTKIRNMFDSGVTFWNDGDEVENYALNNH